MRSKSRVGVVTSVPKCLQFKNGPMDSGSGRG